MQTQIENEILALNNATVSAILLSTLKKDELEVKFGVNFRADYIECKYNSLAKKLDLKFIPFKNLLIDFMNKKARS